MECPTCHNVIPEKANFCMQCGCLLQEPECGPNKLIMDSERKHVTIMFSDLSGYTAISEKLDPEEIKEIMNLVFGKISKIIKSYDGFIEKFIGDAVMAIFGVPKAHEDDPIRAIRAALEMHSAIEKISPQLEGIIGRSLSLHTGINTGLVVTGDVDVEKGTHGLAGDAINQASRLSAIAEAKEIIVGSETYFQASNYFDFESREPRKVKGKQHPVNLYKVLGVKKELFKTHRLQGLQASLTGRAKEMIILADAAKNLKRNQGSIILICGNAGTGKSRLKKEFKDSLNINSFQWCEGHAYSYTKNKPYYPLIHLLSKAFQIEDGDPPEKLKSKIESGVAYLLGENRKHTPYIGSLFSVTYHEIEEVSPESWKENLQEAVYTILSALVDKGPTIVCFEDLHWADPSFIELLTVILENNLQKALFICTYRPSFTLFDNNIIKIIDDRNKFVLKDLTYLDAQKMLKSLLDSDKIPHGLEDFVEQKSEGNPFYLEEMVNSLIDFEILSFVNGTWKLKRKVTEADIPATIHGVLTARVDRLDRNLKRLLQEASVVGRTFHYRILDKITYIDKDLIQYLSGLESFDLIKIQSINPDLEYIFKHALIQEVVYDGLLKSERKEIHLRIGVAIEQLFHDRLPEFYETLAFHFSHSRNINKAIFYLMRSGKKNLQIYALDESHQFYKNAYEILTEKPSLPNDEQRMLIEVLINWSFVFFWRADYSGIKKVLCAHINLVDSLDDFEFKGMYYACLGYALGQTGFLNESYDYLRNALKLCKEVKNDYFTAYCYGWLTQTCGEMGLLDEAIVFGKEGQKIAKQFMWDPLLFTETHVWLAIAYYFIGDCEGIKKTANEFIEKGTEKSDQRIISTGHLFIGVSLLAAGDHIKSIKELEKAVGLTKDPVVLYTGKMLLGLNYLSLGRFQKAEEKLNEHLILTQHLQSWVRKSQGIYLLNVALVAKGDLAKGIKRLQKLKDQFYEKDLKSTIVFGEYILGNIYLQITSGNGSKDFRFIINNIGFLIKTIPFAAKKAKNHYLAAIQVAKEIGAKGLCGQSYLDLGRLCMIKRKNNEARKYISDAIKIFEECKAYVFLKQAKRELESLS